MLLGHYGEIPCDSEVWEYLGVSPKAAQKEVERFAANSSKAQKIPTPSHVTTRRFPPEPPLVDHHRYTGGTDGVADSEKPRTLVSCTTRKTGPAETPSFNLA
jgi:hypothetical protein